MVYYSCVWAELLDGTLNVICGDVAHPSGTSKGCNIDAELFGSCFS